MADMNVAKFAHGRSRAKAFRALKATKAPHVRVEIVSFVALGAARESSAPGARLSTRRRKEKTEHGMARRLKHAGFVGQRFFRSRI